MTRNEILKQVNAIFRDVFEDDNIIVNETTNADDILEWDSLAQIELIHAHEAYFKLKFGMRQILNMQNVGDMIDIIEDKVNS